MDSTIQHGPAPVVTVIIPARNEEANLERCLRSLVVQQGVPFELLLVDDASTDRTREIAESFTRAQQCPFVGLNADFAGLRILDAAQPLPEGWSGKCNALVAAEPAARGEWLLFTDADTEHLEGSLALALHEAQHHRVDLISYSPEQLLSGVRQQLVMPLIFGELATTYSPSRINNPEFPDAAANGQYMLVRAAAHQRAGGFASVAGSLLEDVALARRYKEMGYKIRFRLGKGLVRTRMYGSWEQTREGWTKNLALLFPNAVRLARLREREFLILLLLPLFALAWTAHVLTLEALSLGAGGPVLHWGARHWGAELIGIVLWLLSLSRFAVLYARASRAHLPFWPTLFSVFGLPLYAGLLRRSVKAHLQGSVRWRGRAYSGAGAAQPPTASNSR